MGLNGFLGFRGSSAAAPLKDMQLWWMTRRSPRYPRLISRGPIEGSRYFACLPESWLYPRLISRGPIEEPQAGDPTVRRRRIRGSSAAAPLKDGLARLCAPHNWGYPRLISRGPIEGRQPSQARMPRRVRIRGSSAAAPLKGTA